MKVALPHNLEAQSLAGVVILVGGLSTRMGSHKALLKLPSGETLLDYHVRSAARFGVPILVADNGQGFVTQVETANRCIGYIDDYQPHSSNPEAESKHSAGPLGAILAGMQQLLADNDFDNGKDNCSEAESPEAGLKWMLVVSCDSLVSAWDIWQHLKAQSLATESVPARNSLATTAITDKESAQKQMYGLADKERDYPLLALYQLSLAQPLKAYLNSGERRVMRFINPISQSLPMPQAWHTLCNLNTPEHFQTACQQL